MGDAARLRQVLLNLAGNAIKFTDRRRGADRRAGQANEIRFTVRDTGIGIAPEEQDRIFLEFEQADGASTREFGGTGLGLAISKRIVERMGGRIAVESEPGAGATFEFIVPLPPAPALRRRSIRRARSHRRRRWWSSPPSQCDASLLVRRLGRWGAKACIVMDESAAAAIICRNGPGMRCWSIPLGVSAAANGVVRDNSHSARIVLDHPRRAPRACALR